MQSPVKVQIGETYLVPTAIAQSGKDKGNVVPILYPKHSDGPEICANPAVTHYHIDRRFSHVDYDAYVESCLADFKMRRMTCISKFTGSENYWPFMIERLHRLYNDHQLKNNRCPHQGTQVVNDCGTCPNHGLIWDLQTGKLKYKLPFYLEHGKNKGIIENGKCKIEVVETFSGPANFNLVDADGRTYPNAVYKLDAELQFKPGFHIEITDGNCGLNV